MTTCGIYRYNALLRSKDSFDENDKFDDCNTSNTNLANNDTTSLRNPTLEVTLYENFEHMIDEFEKDIEDYPEIPCCSCNRLFKRSQVTKVSLSDNLGINVWPRLEYYILQKDPNVTQDLLYMCTICKSNIRKEKLPARCVLNGLETVPVPKILDKLDSLSVQLVQRAKCYQTIVRLGTYTAKVPTYNSLKACKGNMFFLPLPMSKTMETLDEVKQALPNPELYVILNGQPTNTQVVWRSLVNVRLVKAAVHKLKQINWLYKDVDPDSVDDATKKVVEVINNTSSKMLEKATKEDIAGFQSYTIRNMYTKLSTESDIDQFKLLYIKENPLDNRQKYLDVMCFPTLFPDGRFGEYHDREVKLTASEYAKSRLLNKDARYRKNPQYVFYLLWQKELRDLSAGIYSFLKSTRGQPMAVGSLINKLNVSDEVLEGNLSTVLQTIRGSKQYWFTRQSEVKCMIREYGSPMIFLTLSCSEYSSPDIAEYLHKVNNVPSTYNIGRLCTEDPLSVSRQFSYKFKSFFKIVVRNNAILGTVDHYYWKKEYQARGAPHYHILLWIRDAPVIGKDPPEKVIK